MKQPTEDGIKQQLYISSVLKNLKDFIGTELSKLSQSVFKVQVTNPDTNLLKETAENTRKTAGRLEKLLSLVDLPKLASTNLTLPSKLNLSVSDVTISNQPKVEVVNFPKQKDFPTEIKVSNLADLKLAADKKEGKLDLSSLEKRLDGLKSAFFTLSEQLSNQKTPEIKIPEQKQVKIPEKMSFKEAGQIISALTDGLQGVRDDLGEVYKALGERGEGLADKVEVTNFPPQHIPTPVTNININSLKGIPLSTVVTVTSTAKPLPATPLTQRRSLIVYNNSSNTIYIGGADVTTVNGFPVAVSSYSPPIDAGEHMLVYAIAASGSNNVRVLEVSNDAEGN
jgi:hypothetical protein